MYLRQSTSATVMIGPYTGSDGVALAGLTLTQSEIMLSKNGAAFVAKNETTNGSHRILGMYSAMFNDTDLNTAGRLKVVSSAAAALPVWHDFTVLPTSVFDYMFATGIQQVALGSSVVTSAAFAVGGVQRMANMFAVDMSSISVAISARSPVNALRAIRNRITSSGQVMAVYAEDDTTAVWTATLTTNASADPIVESNPA